MPSMLIVSFHYPPSTASGAFRLVGFARHLNDLGWDVRVVCAEGVPLEPVDADSVMHLTTNGVEVSYVPYPDTRLSQIQRRVYSKTGLEHPHFVWLSRAIRECRRLLNQERSDVVLTSSPPHFLQRAGLTLKRQFGIKWIADFRDPWVSGNWSRTRCAWYQRFWERRSFAAADLVVANAPNALRALIDEFPEHARKMLAITNGFDPEAFLNGARRDLESNVSIVHAGELYAGRNPTPIIAGMSDAKKQGIDIELQLIGRAESYQDRLERELREYGLEGKSRFTGQLSYADACTEMTKAGILLLLDSPRRMIGVPAKLYEYLGAGRPILALAEPGSDTEWALKNSGAMYRLVSPSDQGGICEALVDLARGVLTGKIPQRDEEIVKKFTRRYTAELLAEAGKSLLQGKI